MSDQLSKACACKTPAACKAHGCCIESAAPVEVDEVDGYAAGMEARDMHAEARLLRTLARQLAEATHRAKVESDRIAQYARELAEAKAEANDANMACIEAIDRAEQAESALAAATRRVAEVEGALDHIARVGMGSRNKTKRTQWIIARAISALNGDENWRGQETPHGYHDALEAKEPAK